MKPLTLLMIPMLALGTAGLLSDNLSEVIGPIEYNGYLGFSFDGVETTVNEVEWVFEEEIGESLIIVEVPPGWDYEITINSVILTGGELAPGDHLQVTVSFKEYVAQGDRPLEATGITIEGEPLKAEGVLEVSELNLLKILEILNQLSVPLVAGGLIAGGAGLLRPGRATDPIIKFPEEEELPPYVPEEEKEPPEEEEEEHTCSVGYRWMHQVMDLTVGPGTEEGLLYRTPPDDPMPLRATGYDRHYLIHECTCPKTGGVSRESYLMFANVRYEWEIIRGKGGFIDINDENLKKKDTGENVIYMPPSIEDPEKKEYVTVMTTIYHDDKTKGPDHDPVTVYLDMEITREITETGETTKTDTEYTDPGDITDEYLYKLTLRKSLAMGNAPPEATAEDCIPAKEWLKGGSIEGDIVHLPSEVAYGDFARFKASGNDTDEIALKCLPGGGEACTKEKQTGVVVNDELEYQWTASKGSFPRGGYGRECVWQAPDEEGEVTITLLIKDKGRQFSDEPKRIQKKIIVRKLGIDLVKSTKTWLPDAANGTFKALATTYICRDGKWTTPGRKKYARFKLTKVSREPGVCLNYPKDANKNPDLFFHEEKNKDNYLHYKNETDSGDCPTEILKPGDNPAHQKHHLIAVSKRMESSAKPIIRVEDYGAVGQLTAYANHCVQIPPREEEKAHENCKEGKNTIKLPRDENSNDIADGADQDLNGAAANQDNDEKPTGEGNGDGLTNYEEYRGFIVGGTRNVTMNLGRFSFPMTMGGSKQHARTSVKKKDVFVYDADFLGTGMLDVTGLDIHILYLEDLFNGTDKREINFNHGRHHGGLQHGLWLRNKNMPGLYGMACGGTNGPPKNKTHICINVAVNTAAGEPANRLANSIGHELCHGLNIWHHGEGGNHNCGDGTWNYTANSQGRLTSGNINCIMRYDQYAVAWCHGAAHHNHKYATITAQPDGSGRITYNDPVGTLLCKTSAGTGLNNAGAGHINNATRGNCQGQLKVKDW